MSRLIVLKPIQWVSAADLASLALPELPKTKHGAQKLIHRVSERYTIPTRRRAGRGGGLEYSLPALLGAIALDLEVDAARIRALARKLGAGS